MNHSVLTYCYLIKNKLSNTAAFTLTNYISFILFPSLCLKLRGRVPKRAFVEHWVTNLSALKYSFEVNLLANVLIELIKYKFMYINHPKTTMCVF